MSLPSEQLLISIPSQTFAIENSFSTTQLTSALDHQVTDKMPLPG